MSPAWKQKDKQGTLEAKFLIDYYEVLRAFFADFADVS